MASAGITCPPVPPPAPWLIALLRASPWVARVFTGIARRSTVDWVRPVEVLREELGVTYSPFTRQWKVSRDMDVNYMLVAQKG